MNELRYPCSEKKVLISFAVTAKLICAFVFAYAKCLFSHDKAHMLHMATGESKESDARPTGVQKLGIQGELSQDGSNYNNNF